MLSGDIQGLGDLVAPRFSVSLTLSLHELWPQASLDLVLFSKLVLNGPASELCFCIVPSA